MAKKASPRPMLRLSIEMPEIASGSWPDLSARMAAAMSEMVQREVMRKLCLVSRAQRSVKRCAADPGPRLEIKQAESPVCAATLRVATRPGHAVRKFSCPHILQRRRHGVVVRERHHPVADDLAGFMTFAGDQQHITLYEPGNGGADRFAAVSDLDGALCLGKDRSPDRRGVLAARIVVSDNDAVGVLGSDAAHDRPLAGVAV